MLIQILSSVVFSLFESLLIKQELFGVVIISYWFLSFFSRNMYLMNILSSVVIVLTTFEHKLTEVC